MTLNPSRAAVSLWGHTTQISSSLSPKRDCSPKRVNKQKKHAATRGSFDRMGNWRAQPYGLSSVSIVDLMYGANRAHLQHTIDFPLPCFFFFSFFKADLFAISYDLAHHLAGWDPCDLHDLLIAQRTCFLGWIYTTQILRNLSRQATNQMIYSTDHDLSVRGVKLVT